MPTALIQLYNEMEENPQIGGCCGEILVDNITPFHNIGIECF